MMGLGSVTEFVQQWGYVAVFMGAMIEGESVILTASALAAAGYLSIQKVMIWAFLGTLIADQLLFFVGYYYGEKGLKQWVHYFPKSAPYLQKGLSFLEKYQTAYLLIFRFIYGVRIISPIIIGAQKVPFRRFALLNFLAAIIWSVLSCLLGYYVGEVFIILMKKYGWVSLMAVAVAIILIFAIRYGLKKRSKKSS